MKKSTLDTLIIINGIFLFFITDMLLGEIFALRHVHTVTFVLEVIAIFCSDLNYRAYWQQRRGENIDVVGDLLNEGERTVRASEFWVGSWWTPLFLCLSATVKTDGKVQWVVLSRDNHEMMPKIGSGEELLFKNADGGVREISNHSSWGKRAEYKDLFSGRKAWKGLYPINLEMLDALCREDIIKVRANNWSDTWAWDVDVKGQNLANLFRISRNVIEKALETEKTAHSDF